MYVLYVFTGGSADALPQRSSYDTEVTGLAAFYAAVGYFTVEGSASGTGVRLQGEGQATWPIASGRFVSKEWWNHGNHR